MKHLKSFNESLMDDNILSVKVKCTNTENINPTKLEDLDWIDAEFWIKECLENLFESDKSSIIKDGDILLIGTDKYDWSLVKINSINDLDFEINRKKYLPLVKSKYGDFSQILKNPDIEFTFNNKYNFLKLFSEKYPDLYKKLSNRYNAVEYGGNMVDFRGEWVIYSEWDFDDRSGSEYKLCKIEDLLVK